MTGPDQAVAVPALPLRPFVSHYAGSRMRDVPPGQHAGLPSRHLDLIVSLAKPIEILRMPGAQSPGLYRAFVAGLHQTPALVRMGGDLDCLHVFLKPGAARALHAHVDPLRREVARWPRRWCTSPTSTAHYAAS